MNSHQARTRLCHSNNVLKFRRKCALIYKHKTFSCPFCTLISGTMSQNLVTSLLKKNAMYSFFFFEITKPFLTLNLPQNKFHKILRKVISFHPKFSWHRPKLTYKKITMLADKKSCLNIRSEILRKCPHISKFTLGMAKP